MKFFALISAAGLSVASAETTYTTDAALGMSQVNPTTMSAPFELGSAITSSGSKSLLVGLSAEVALWTFTEATSKSTGKPNRETAIAEAGMQAEVRFLLNDTFTELGSSEAVCNAKAYDSAVADDLLDNQTPVFQAYPGIVTFYSREQTLSVETMLEIEGTNCTDCNVTGYVSVGLNTSTVSAQHFNYIAALPETGSAKNPWKIVSCWHVFQSSTVTQNDDGSDAGARDSYVGLGKRMLVVQEVLASQSGGGTGVQNKVDNTKGFTVTQGESAESSAPGIKSIMPWFMPLALMMQQWN